MRLHASSIGPVLLLLGIVVWILIPILDISEPIFNLKLGLGTFILLATLVFALAKEMHSVYLKRTRHQYQQKLKESRQGQAKEHRQFIHRLDHEIKNPLTTLRVEVENLLAAENQAAQERAARNARSTLQRIGRLLNDLRKISELEETLSEVELIDVAHTLEDTVELTRSAEAHQGRRIRLFIPEVPRSLPRVQGDPDLLQLAFHNLLDNALKFSSPNDAVEVRLSENEETIVVQFADNGLGIPPEEETLIFADLYRGSNAMHIEGSGLGLSLVQRIARLHGGRVHLRNFSDSDQGTIFSFELPTFNSMLPVTKR